MGRNRRNLGEKGERVARDYLRRQGYRILEENYSCRLGEIDLIAHQGDTLVFIEVRTKGSRDFGPPQSSVNLHKQRQIARVAEFYLAEKGLGQVDCRFDVVAVSPSLEGGEIKVELIKNAFPKDGIRTF
ncbi:MAG: YraN family protein [candidate division NC10 bacterium]|nr:YraN family protein [candidate division NC10 bacterium]